MDNNGERGLDINERVSESDGVNYDKTRIFIVRRRDMSFVSDYFRRDARRYDNGFAPY